MPRVVFGIACCLLLIGGCKSSGLNPFAWSSPAAETSLGETPTTEPAGTAIAASQPALGSQPITLASATRPAMPKKPTIHTLAKDEKLLDVVEDASGVVLLDFYADWCGPCRKQSTVLHAIEGDAAALGVQIVKVNVDDHQDVARELGVSSLPTLMVMKDRKFVERKRGFTDQTELLSLLKR